MRYHVRNRRGEERVVPSLTDLHDLYAHGFIEDEDYVRSDSSERWTKAARMPALAGVRMRRREPRKLLALVLLAVATAALIALVLMLLR